MELGGWTNDRLVADRLNRIPADQWVYGRTNSSIIMASFVHIPPEGSRFNSGQLGCWYAAATPLGAIAEVAHHLRVAAYRQGVAERHRVYRTYSARLQGSSYLNICGLMSQSADIYDPNSYTASQRFGDGVRARGCDGVIYDSLRLEGSVNAVSFIPPNITDVVQTDHYRISVRTSDQSVDVKKLRLKSSR